jgi:hypothetical protein
MEHVVQARTQWQLELVDDVANTFNHLEWTVYATRIRLLKLGYTPDMHQIRIRI